MEFINATPPRKRSPPREDDAADLKKGPWTLEEDLLLANYVSLHGEGRWDSVARNAGLKRTGKSCRLRWLNYLRPDVRHGNITPQEQLVILELHSRWGNRWSKIAQHLPGRTDNEIKNYWRTRVQKHARQLRCDVNSKQFKDMVRHLWMPRLIERITFATAAAAATSAAAAAQTSMHQAPELAPAKLSSSPESSSSGEQQFSTDNGVEGGAAELSDICWLEGPEPSPGACDDLWLQDLEERWWSMEDLWPQQELQWSWD